MRSEVELSSRAGIATILLNRPHKRNALTATMLERTVVLLKDLGREPNVRVVRIGGLGCLGLT
ncbi:MAG: hypothetical protein ACREA0_31500 [bacterium]